MEILERRSLPPLFIFLTSQIAEKKNFNGGATTTSFCSAKVYLLDMIVSMKILILTDGN